MSFAIYCGLRSHTSGHLINIFNGNLPQDALCARAFVPRIEHRDTGLVEVAGVARDDRQTVMQCGCCDDQIGLRVGMPGLAPVLDQEPPLEHDILADRQGAFLEHRPHLVRQPLVKLGTVRGVGDQFNAEADFGEGDDADEQ